MQELTFKHFLFVGISKNMADQTKNLDNYKQQIDTHGYCIIEDLIPTDIVAEIHQRISTQASAEKNYI